MKLVSIGGLSLVAYGLAGDADASGIVRGLPGPDRSPNTLERTGAPALIAGIRRGARPIPMILRGAGNDRAAERAVRRFLGLLDVESDAKRLIVCQMDADGDNILDSTVECLGVAGGWAWIDAEKAATITFFSESPAWFAQTPTYNPGPTGSDVYTVNSSPELLTVANDGETTARPLIGLCLASGGQRVTSTATVGWRYRQRFPVTNETADNWYAELGTLDLGDTSALVSGGKALASGDDLRVRLEGRDLPRTLTNWNTLRTFVHVPMSIPAEETVEFEVIYGNPNAEAPTDGDATRGRADGFSTMSNYGIVNGKYTPIDLTGDGGTATSGTATVLVDNTKAWPDDYWRGGFVQIVGGPSSSSDAKRRILTSSGNAITVDRGFGSVVLAGAVYVLWKSGQYVNGGRASVAGGTTLLTDDLALFGTSEVVGYKIWNQTQGFGPATITHNTKTTVTHAAFPVAWASADRYYIEGPGFHSYNVRQGDQTYNAGLEVWHKGMFQITRHYTKPPDLDLDGSQSVGGWSRTTLLDNQDDYAQASWISYGGSPIGTYGQLYAQRRKSSARTYKEEKQGDALAIADPRGYKGARFDYTMRNSNAASGSTLGIGKFVFAKRETGAQEWEWVKEDDTKQPTTTSAVAYYNLSATKPQLLAMGQVPRDETAIETGASASDEIKVENGTRLELLIDPLSITYGASAGEEAIYDLNGDLASDWIAAISQATGDVLRFGGQGHHIHLATDEVLWVDCETGAVYLTGGGPISLSGGFPFRRYAPWAVRPLRFEDDADNDGVSEPKVSASWMPIAPGSQTWRWIESAVGTLEIVAIHYGRYLG